MAPTTKELLHQCLYALGEAKVNTELAISLEDRKNIKDELTEDWQLFDCLQSKIRQNLESQKVKKIIDK